MTIKGVRNGVEKVIIAFNGEGQYFGDNPPVEGWWNEGSRLVRKMMADDYITAAFTTYNPVKFLIGDWLDLYFGEHFYGRYEIVENYKPVYDANTGSFKYELKMEASYMKWKNKILKYSPQTGGRELNFSLTSSLSTHLYIITQNIASHGYTYNGTPYTAVYDSTVDAEKAKLVQYSNTSILDAITSVAKTWECEWWVTDSVIHFGKCQAEGTTPTPFILGAVPQAYEGREYSTLSDMSRSSSGADYITKLYVFGSEKNLTASYKKGETEDLTKTAVVQRRLMLPTAEEMAAIEQGMEESEKLSVKLAEKGYTLNADGSITTEVETDDEYVEGVLVIDDIYPKTDMEVVSYTTEEEDIVEEDNEGNEKITHYTYYHIKAASYDITREMRLDGQTLHIIFTSGSLNGMDFECEPDDEEETYEVIGNESYGRFLPDQYLHPKTAAEKGTTEGDKFALYNWDATKLNQSTLIRQASYKLLEKAIEYLDKAKIDPNAYPCTEETTEETFVMRDYGDMVELVNHAYFPDGPRQSRISGMELKLDCPYDHPVWTVAEKADYVFQGNVGSTQSVTVNGTSYSGTAAGGGGTGGSSVYLIRLNDATRPTDSNAYSARRERSEFLKRNEDDTAHGRITFNGGFDSNEPSTTKGLSNTGDIVNTGNLVMGEEQTYTTTPVARTANFNRGYLGWEVDNRGNAEVESLTVRSLLKVTELLINRLQGQEGDTLFSDNDQIESVRQEGDSYVLTLKEKWEGYRTAQQYGNIVKGIVNTLAARSVSDVTEAESVESDGVNKYYTSWMYVTGDSHTEPSLLSPNQIRVAVYGDDMVPAAKNFPPCRLMNIARWGCIDYGTPIEDGDSAETIAEKTRILDSIERRQRLFYITSSEGRIVKMRKVNSPILRPENFGTTLGTLPDFLYNWQQVAEKAIPGRDYLYAQGIVAQSIIQVYPNGDPKQVFVDCGEWVDGTGTADPPIGGGTYLCYEWHEEAGQWETHDVWHNGCKWRALQHQPVTSEGVKMYHEPKWNSQYWKLVEGDGSLEMYLVSSEGNLFRPGHVDTVVSPYLYCGSVDITADIDAQYWTWTRHTESSVDSGGNPVYTPADEVWNAAHTAVRELHLTNGDMPTAWSRDNKAVFTCTVAVNDGNDTIIVQNHVTA